MQQIAVARQPAPEAPARAASSSTAAPLRAPRGAVSAPRRAAPSDRLILAAVLAVPAGVSLLGLPYYLLDRAARVRDPAHAWLRPSGPLGLAFGGLGFGLFLFMWLYPLRKKLHWLAFTGAVGQWLRVHVLAGLALPLLVAVHAGWRFDGLIGLGYWALLLVCASGIMGRYLYVRIPRSQSGLELTLDEVAGERRALITRIAAATRLDPASVEKALATDPRSYAGLDPARTVLRLVADDWARWRAMRDLGRRWARPRPGAPALDRPALAGALKLARREMALSQQARMLEASRRVFGYWHVAHRPVAVTALLAVLVHVIVAMAVGVVRIG